MKTLSSRDVQKNFGVVADLVQSGEPVQVTKYGRPAFVMVPAGISTNEFLRRISGRRLTEMLETANPNEAARTLSQQEVNHLIESCLA